MIDPVSVLVMGLFRFSAASGVSLGNLSTSSSLSVCWHLIVHSILSCALSTCMMGSNSVHFISGFSYMCPSFLFILSLVKVLSILLIL